MEQFEPGDRVVINFGETRHPNMLPNGSFGTITGTGSMCELVEIDGKMGAYLINRDYIERQPIEPGCYVRWLNQKLAKEMSYYNVRGHRVATVGEHIVILEDYNQTWLKDVVRIADPEPVARVSDDLPEPDAFAVWLTTRPNVISVGGSVTVYDMFEALKEYNETHRSSAMPPIWLIRSNDHFWSYTNIEPNPELDQKVYGPLLKLETAEQLVAILNGQTKTIRSLNARYECTTATPDNWKNVTKRIGDILTTVNRFIDPNRLIGQKVGLLDRLGQLEMMVSRLQQPTFKRGDPVRVSSFSLRVRGRIVYIDHANRWCEIMTENGHFHSNISLDMIEHV